MSLIWDWLVTSRARARSERVQAEAGLRMAESALRDWARMESLWSSDDDDQSERDWPSGLSKAGLAWDPSTPDLATARAKSRQLYIMDPTARGIIDRIVGLVLQDTGLDTTFNHEDKKLVEAADLVWTDWAEDERNCWIERLDEAFWRTLIDGELLIRWFDDSENIRPRFIDPERLGGGSDHPDGIVTDPEDIETVRQFLIKHPDGSGKINVDTVEADQCTWWKIGTESTVKRGLPLLFASLDTVKSYSQWLYDLLLLVRQRTSIALVRKHLGATPAQIKSFADTRKTGTTTETAQGTQRTVRRQRMHGGTIIDTGNTEYQYLAPNVDARDLSNVGRELGLRLSQGTGLAEYMARMDGTSGTYAGVLVSQGPTLVEIRRWQRRLASHVQRSAIRRVLMANQSELGGVDRVKELVAKAKIRGPRFPRGERGPDVAADNVAVNGGWMSLRTAAIRDGLDPDEEARYMADEESREAYPQRPPPPAGGTPNTRDKMVPGRPGTPPEVQPPNNQNGPGRTDDDQDGSQA